MQHIGTWGIGEFLIAIVVICAAIGIAWIVMGVAGVKPPAWAINIFWIVLACLIGIAAIRFVMTL